MPQLPKFLIATLSGLTLTAAALAQTDELALEQISNNTFSIRGDLPAETSIEWSARPDTWTDARPVATEKVSAGFQLPVAYPILRVNNLSNPPTYLAPRAVPLEGAVNFRDLGGYFTRDGRQVKWGKIYRSADISQLTDRDLKLISDLRIRIVCDLRGEHEVASAPDRLPGETQWVHLPAGSENSGKETNYAQFLKHPDSTHARMLQYYSRTDHLSAKYKPMFDQLLTLPPDQALMFHCSAGKDRTGIGAAFILAALGVDEPTILRDYEATNHYRKGGNNAFIKRMTDQGMSEAAAQALMAANPEWLRATFTSIHQKYGSMDAFLEREMGLTAEKRAALQQMYLY